MTQTKAHYSKWTLPIDFTASFLPQPGESRCPYGWSAALLPLGNYLVWESGKRRVSLGDPSYKTMAGSNHPTSVSPSPPTPVLVQQALALAYRDIASYKTKGTYSCPKLLSKIITVMNTSVRGRAGPGRGVQLGT